MRLARRAPVAALATLMLLSVAFGQTLRQEVDKCNQASTTGRVSKAENFACLVPDRGEHSVTPYDGVTLEGIGGRR